jgi:hypothetical protein
MLVHDAGATGQLTALRRESRSGTWTSPGSWAAPPGAPWAVSTLVR